MRTVFLGLGTNLDHRDEWLERGLHLLEDALVSRRAVQAMTTSPVYETEAWGMAVGTPSFLNMVVAVETDSLPLQVMVVLVVVLEMEKTPQERVYIQDHLMLMLLDKVMMEALQVVVAAVVVVPVVLALKELVHLVVMVA